jgi:REP element-mobilizing transposase RayT
MPRHLRYQSTPWATHLVTTRCTEGRALLSPTPALNAIIAGCLARSLELCQGEVKLHHYVFMSNHYHLLLSARCSYAKARFMCHLNGNLAREICRTQEKSDHVWEGRYASHQLLDDEAVIDAYKYLFKNSVKEGLVAHPREWPGLHGWSQLCGGRELVGEWVDRTGYYYAQQSKRGRALGLEAFTHRLPVTLCPAPCLDGLEPQVLRARLCEFAEEAVAEAVEVVALRRVGSGGAMRENRALGAMEPMGAEAVCAQAVDLPRPLKRGCRPLCRAGCGRLWREFVEAYRGFVVAFQRCSRRVRAGVLGRFPEGGVAFFIGSRNMLTPYQ